MLFLKNKYTVRIFIITLICLSIIIVLQYSTIKNYLTKLLKRNDAYAYYYESYDKGNGGMGSTGESTFIKSGGHRGGYCRYLIDVKKGYDFNHVPNFGLMYLVSYLSTGPIYSPTSYLSGGDPDLTDAKVSVSIRGHNFKPNGADLVWWIAAQKNINVLNEISEDGVPLWRRANWAYSSIPLTKYLLDGKWHRVEFQLKSDAALWKYAGNNPDQGIIAKRYEYWPIEDVLSHVNVDFIFALININDENQPSGSIDFDELVIKYKNRSLIHSNNGGKLISCPEGNFSNAAKLTDGVRIGEKNMWTSSENSSSPQVFVYSMHESQTISTIQLHQNIEYPAKNVEILVSLDGKSYSTVLKEKMPNHTQNSIGDNLSFIIKREIDIKAKYIKIIIMDGYKNKWGLGEIEIFNKREYLSTTKYHSNSEL